MLTGRKKLFSALAFVLAVAALAAVLFFREKEDGLTATGMIEITKAELTPKVGGYLVRRDFQEGDAVEAGKVIAVIDRTDYELGFMQAKEAYRSALALLDDLYAGSRSEETASLAAALEVAERAMNKAVSDFERFERLYAEGAIAAQQLENYRLAMVSGTGAYKQALFAYQLALDGSRRDLIRAQKHTVAQLDYALRAAKINLEHTELKSPINGRVLSKNYETGEFVQPGAPIATIGDFSDCWVKIYVPSTHLGRIKHGQEANVMIDSYPGRVFPGVIRQIAEQAEFTPRQTITKSERANLVFAVKVGLNNEEGFFKPGMPAEVILP
ncbi:MAG: efflux RND transporter periplasmic adaptor subunit [Acidaminococcales bacterium]|jgi:HlyD family secretion protein|nr:efflux RND transporter periplasmic adaptor subunit [Acidaminococcales bacterium]